MEYTIWLYSDKAEQLKNQLPEQVTLLPGSEKTVDGTLQQVSVEVNSGVDVLSIFHAGTVYGLNLMLKKEWRSIIS